MRYVLMTVLLRDDGYTSEQDKSKRRKEYLQDEQLVLKLDLPAGVETVGPMQFTEIQID